MTIEMESFTVSFRVSGEPYLDVQVDGRTARLRATDLVCTRLARPELPMAIDITGVVVGSQRIAHVRFDDSRFGDTRPLSQAPWWARDRLERIPGIVL